ncbi:hypothetical protein [Loktanella atrilutea]|uniref:hypothetical protein n=1 Tax=Loktanella atrilutea TaxID=366533 RepID=UPI0009339645|nr:hypothetical protein [Loktanella atrilutea]
MAPKMRPAFTQQEADAWSATMVETQPAEPTPAEGRRAVEATSFALRSWPHGVVLRLATGVAPMTDIHLNPVMAINLMMHLQRAGLAGGWLSPDGQLSSPQVEDRPRGSGKVSDA